MTQFTVKTPDMMKAVIAHLESRTLPCTIYIEKGAKRSTAQERTHRMWMRELEEQGDQMAEEYRGFSKLWFGVGLLKYQSEPWAVAYDNIVKPLDYDQKLKLMMEPISYPLTSIMTTKTFAQYLNDVFQYWTGRLIDTEAPLDEFSLEHFNLVNRLRDRFEPPTFILTIPKQDD